MLSYQDNILTFESDLTRDTVPLLKKKLKKYKFSGLEKVDLSQIHYLDSAGVAFLEYLKDLKYFNQIEFMGLSKELQGSVDIFSSSEIGERPKVEKLNFISRIGDKTLQLFSSYFKMLFLTSEIFFWSFVGTFSRKGQRKGSIIQQSVQIGVEAVGIIALLSFIIGLILAMQSAVQLRQFGANIFVADLIAISMVREMGPMMTAIIVAGRSGSAIASEIATMKVTEELDALRMMALNPIRYIVVPKFIGISITLPFLVMLSIVVGMMGGLTIGVFYLDLTVNAYVMESFSILNFTDVFVGLSKSLFFGWVIVIISSYYGFEVKGGAEGVGKVTTYAVVASIFAVIVLDAIFSLIFLV